MDSQDSQVGASAPRKTALPTPTPESNPQPPPKLTLDQEAKYEMLLSKAKSWTTITCDREVQKSGPITDRELAWITRECLLRYLRATKWSVDDAAERIQATLAWRRGNGLDDFTSEYFSPEQATGKQIIIGYDKFGRPCQYLSPVHWVIRGFLKIILAFVDPITRDKFKFNEDAKQYVPAEQLWSEDWAGKLDFEYDHESYWPALHKLCEQRSERKTARWVAAGRAVGVSEDYRAGCQERSTTGDTTEGGDGRTFDRGDNTKAQGSDEKWTS